MKVSIFLIAGANDSSPEDERFRQRLEREVQSLWDDFYSSKSKKEFTLLSGLRAVLRSGWFPGIAHGRKVRFQAEINGEIYGVEAAGYEEINELIGNDKTLKTFVEAFCGDSGDYVWG